MTTKLTDAEIDGLSGYYLSEAVAKRLGWHDVRPGHEIDSLYGARKSGGGAVIILPRYATDKGAALSLLLGLRCVAVNITGSDVSVITGLSTNEIVTIGPKEQAAAVMCKAFLKLANRKAE